MKFRFKNREHKYDRVRLCIPGLLEVEGEGRVAVIGSLFAIMIIGLAHLLN